MKHIWMLVAVVAVVAMMPSEAQAGRTVKKFAEAVSVEKVAAPDASETNKIETWQDCGHYLYSGSSYRRYWNTSWQPRRTITWYYVPRVTYFYYTYRVYYPVSYVYYRWNTSWYYSYWS